MTTSGKDSPPLLLERAGYVATIIINDPPWNRMSLAFMDELEVRIAELASDKSVRALVFRGAGDANFSVGMDLKQLPEGVKQKGSIEALFDQRLRVLAMIESMEKPTVAVMYGYCLGGGLELPLACHFRLAAAEGAKIGLPELDLGSVPAWGGTARLTRCVGRDHALDMILRAKKISGPEAHRIGLVNEVCPNDELQERAQALAQELAVMPPIAVSGVLKCVVGAAEKSLQEALDEERRAVMRTMGTKDQMEGMRAFLEKRKPNFTGEWRERHAQRK
jgi:enoyl-CoA hydratase/carnithine racemase